MWWPLCRLHSCCPILYVFRCSFWLWWRPLKLPPFSMPTCCSSLFPMLSHCIAFSYIIHSTVTSIVFTTGYHSILVHVLTILRYSFFDISLFIPARFAFWYHSNFSRCHTHSIANLRFHNQISGIAFSIRRFSYISHYLLITLRYSIRYDFVTIHSIPFTMKFSFIRLPGFVRSIMVMHLFSPTHLWLTFSPFIWWYIFSYISSRLSPLHSFPYYYSVSDLFICLCLTHITHYRYVLQWFFRLFLWVTFSFTFIATSRFHSIWFCSFCWRLVCLCDGVQIVYIGTTTFYLL